MGILGLFLFSLNYWLVYLAVVHLTSGLVAVIFSNFLELLYTGLQTFPLALVAGGMKITLFFYSAKLLPPDREQTYEGGFQLGPCGL